MIEGSNLICDLGTQQRLPKLLAIILGPGSRFA
jgi:hypothetical protein